MSKKLSYSDRLKDPRWQKKRLEILNRDGFKCIYCNDEKTTLHVHHLKYSGNPWESDNEDLETVCEHCHGLLEYLKKLDSWIPEYIVKIEKLFFDPEYRFFVVLNEYVYIYEYYISDGFSLINSVSLPDVNIIAKLLKEQEEENG